MADFEEKAISQTCKFIKDLEKLNQLTSCYNGNVAYISNATEARDAIRELKDHAEIALDCEGVRIGRNGKLTLVQIGANSGTIYLFDVMKIGHDFKVEFKELLENTKTVKYMYDCRKDSDSLFHEYGIKLCNVLDMQILEFITRPLANTEMEISTKKETHFQKPKVRGLGTAIKTYIEKSELSTLGLEQFFTLKSAGDQLMTAEKTIWRYRPLTSGMINYAALDIEMIWIISKKLQELNPLRNGSTLERLQVASENYSSLWRDLDKLPDDEYTRNPLMLSYLIPDVDKNGDLIPFPDAETKCEGCFRYFHRDFIDGSIRNLCRDCVEIDRVNKAKFRNIFGSVSMENKN